MVEVTQVDRDAAAPYANCLRDMQDIFDGKADNLPVVQAFARHRIAHQPQPSAEQATVDRIVQAIRDQDGYGEWQEVADFIQNGDWQ